MTEIELKEFSVKDNNVSLGGLGMGVQQVGGGGITEETDPTVPQWAKQPNKPTYDYSEIENTPNLSDFASKTEVKEEIAGLINSAPETLDTLGEIAKAIEDNAEVVDVLNQAIGEKASKTELQQVDQKTTNNATAIEEVNQKLNNDYVKNTDYATTDKAGAVKVSASAINGIYIDELGKIGIVRANDDLIKNKVNIHRPIVPENLDYAVKVGVTTNTIDLTDAEKLNAQIWLGIDTLIGDIETALDGIISLQNELIGGGV